MSGNIAITGVPTTPGQGGSVPLRREIRDLQKNFPDQFNLYVLGLQHLQGLNENDVKSYYQIAGIHGLPYKPWNGVGSSTNWKSSSGFGGYCTHSSVLFTTWHRPYVALYEQALYTSVQAVVQRFPAGALRDKYAAAAKDFRAPYFDWAIQPPSGTSAFPTPISSASISVVDVDGTTKSIANPINRFIFHPINPSPGDFNRQWSRYPTTVRYPDSNGRSQESRIAPILANELPSLRSNMSLLLLSYKDFDAFSFNRWDTSTNMNAYGSLEDVHNGIHDRVGGGGHMSSLDASAFDPIFWLHHINVDRFWAIWQALNPNSFITPKPAPTSTFGVNRGASETENTGLTPFWDKSGTRFWTSAQIKDSAATFGYAYPETQRWQFGSTQEYQEALRRTVAGLYGSNVFRAFAASVAVEKRVAGKKDGEGVERVEGKVAESKEAEKNVAEKNVAETRTAENTVAENKVAENKVADSNRVAEGKLAENRVAENKLADSKQPENKGAENKKPDNKEPMTPEAAIPELSLAELNIAAPTNTPNTSTPSTDDETAPIPPSLAHLAPNNTYTEWLVNIRAMKHGLGQSFRVQIFLGPVDDTSPTSWPSSPNSVGRVSILGRLPETGCAKCRDDTAAGLMVSGTVPLTTALLKEIVGGGDGLKGLGEDEVVPYLREALRWKVTMVEEDGGEEMPACDVPGLEVSVVSTHVRIGGDGVPVYSGVYKGFPEVTRGKAGGCKMEGEDEGDW